MLVFIVKILLMFLYRINIYMYGYDCIIGMFCLWYIGSLLISFNIGYIRVVFFKSGKNLIILVW